MWIMQEIITEIQPDFIIETGTWMGGSAFYYATLLKHVNPKGKIITIDIAPKVSTSMKMLEENPSQYNMVKCIFDDYIEVITSNSIDPELIKQLKERTKNKKVMITLDSCHNYEHVIQELNLYSELVSPESYIVVQDTFLDEKQIWLAKWATCGPLKKRAGPRKAVEEFLKKNNDFKIDKSREKFLFTFYPSGYLKKVKNN